MSQSLVLSVSGIYTSTNDLNGLPPGALDDAVNVESRYKNILEPRRGFEGLEDSSIDGVRIKRLINFPINGEDRIVALTDEGNLLYYDEGALPNPWVAVPGDFSSHIVAPNSLNAKSRFTKAGQISM
jgi:hypothetical protein